MKPLRCHWGGHAAALSKRSESFFQFIWVHACVMLGMRGVMCLESSQCNFILPSVQLGGLTLNS